MLLDAIDLNLDRKDYKVDWGSFDLPNCTRCSLCKSRRNVVPPRIVENSPILFVAECPDQIEDMSGIPLSGSRGQVLSQYLSQIGININDCSYINVVQCRNLDKKTGLKKEQVAACKDLVDYYIKKVNPKVIVTLGNAALNRVSKKSGITKYNGQILDHKNYPNSKIIPLVDPLSCLADPKNYTKLNYGLSKLKEFLAVGDICKTGIVEYVDTYDKFNHMIHDLLSKPYFALDIETNTLRDWTKGEIICISFSNRAGHSYVLPWIVGDDDFYAMCKTEAVTSKKRQVIQTVGEFCNIYKVNKPKFFWEGTDVKEKLGALLAYPNVAKVLHNYMYDYKFLEQAGLKICGKIYDTMIMHYLLDESRGTHGLDYVCLRFTEYGRYWKGLDQFILRKEDKRTKIKMCDTYAIIPILELIKYAGTDSDVTLQVFEKFYVQLQQEPKLMTLMDSFLMPLSELLMETEKNGVKVDREYLTKIEGILSGEVDRLDNRLKEYAPDTNFNSTKQLRHLLFTLLRLPPQGQTDKGEDSTDEDVLTKLSNLHEVPKLILERRKKNKLLTTYVRGVDYVIWNDSGKVHPFFNLCGTETGRLSSNSPNMQNLPRPTDIMTALGINIKNLFISSDDDYYIVETDYSQAELRLIAEYSRDRNLYAAFMAGRDPHCELAVRIYHKHRVPEMLAGLDARLIVTKDERQKAKTANFSLAYGKSAKNFGEENGIPYDEALEIHTVYWETYTDVAAWKQEELRKGYANGFFESFFGRKRRIPKLYSQDQFIRGEAEREGINFVIQSQASDYTLYSTMKITSTAKGRGYRFRTISFVHDSAVYEVHKDDIQPFLTLLQDIMIHPPGVTIPMESEVKVGNRLGKLTQWTKDSNNLWGPEKKEEKAALN